MAVHASKRSARFGIGGATATLPNNTFATINFSSVFPANAAQGGGDFEWDGATQLIYRRKRTMWVLILLFFGFAPSGGAGANAEFRYELLINGVVGPAFNSRRAAGAHGIPNFWFMPLAENDALQVRARQQTGVTYIITSGSISVRDIGYSPDPGGYVLTE